MSAFEKNWTEYLPNISFQLVFFIIPVDKSIDPF